MRRFSADEVAAVVRSADARLNASARLVIVGGTAIGLLADSSRSTTDLDVLPGTSPDVIAALEEAGKDLGLPVPVQPVGVLSAPDTFEDRLQVYPIPGLRHLQVLLPEPHDLALMKLARGAEHDLQAIELLNTQRRLDADVLLERFGETWVTGRRETFATAYLVLVEQLFGKDVADAHERLIALGA